MDLASELARVVATLWHLPLLAVVGWVVRIPFLSREEGHEAITRVAWESLALTVEQQRALISGVRAPDVSAVGLLISALPFAQRRHALRAWSGTTTAEGIREMRSFVASRHHRALALPDTSRRWAVFGEILHCLQDSYSPAHTDRAGARILRMKHWSPLDRLRRRAGAESDEHGFPSDPRDGAWANGSLTEEALWAVAASRSYLELVLRPAESPDGFGVFLDQCVPTPGDGGGGGAIPSGASRG